MQTLHVNIDTFSTLLISCQMNGSHVQLVFDPNPKHPPKVSVYLETLKGWLKIDCWEQKGVWKINTNQ